MHKMKINKKADYSVIIWIVLTIVLFIILALAVKIILNKAGIS